MLAKTNRSLILITFIKINFLLCFLKLKLVTKVLNIALKFVGNAEQQ